MDKETAAVFLIIICVIAGIAVAQPLMPNETERFSSLGLLGPNQTLANYPTNIVANQSISLYASIGNYEGIATFYSVLVKLLSNSSTVISNSTALNAPIIARYSYALSNSETVTIPMNISVSSTGNQLRLVFELWSFDPEVSNFTYTGLSNYLWINVTRI